jgi:hypothetical protein
MDCSRCGTPNMQVAQFCRRCGERLPQRDAWVLGAMDRETRKVRAADLRAGRVAPADSWLGALAHDLVPMGNVAEALLEAVRDFDAAAVIRLTDSHGPEYEMVIEGAGLVARLVIRSPYVRLDLRGPREAVRQVVRRLVARHGEDLFAAHDGRWDRFLERTGLGQAENKSALLELLS